MKPSPPETPPPGCEEFGGQVYMRDAKGSLVPLELVRPADRLKDELVRRLAAEAEVEVAAIAKSRARALADVDALVELVANEYGTTLGGKKGNVTLDSVDGLWRVQVQVADSQHFGEELQVAKALVDECLLDWGADARAEIRAIVQNAFDVRKEGQVNRGALFGLLRLDITDPRWLRAMKAIRDSIRVDGSKEYIRFYRRPNVKAKWSPITVDAAAA